jgi:hypothetical protein
MGKAIEKILSEQMRPETAKTVDFRADLGLNEEAVPYSFGATPGIPSVLRPLGCGFKVRIIVGERS